MPIIVFGAKFVKLLTDDIMVSKNVDPFEVLHAGLVVDPLPIFLETHAADLGWVIIHGVIISIATVGIKIVACIRVAQTDIIVVTIFMSW